MQAVTVRVPVRGELLAWARDRSRVSPVELGQKFPALVEWEAGTKQPTLKQLEKFAQATHTPIGYLFLAEPPEESLPVPDFRTIGDMAIGQASPDLFDTGYFTLSRFRAAYADERERVLAFMEDHPSGGGNFYNIQPVRVSKRFARALIESTLEGHTLHRDAYQMLGFKKHSTFDEIARHLGVV